VSSVDVSIEINGAVFDRRIEPRLLLSDFIRHEARLTGTHVGCEHGVCGACTVQLEGVAVRSCLLLAVQANRRRVRTVEGMVGADGALHPLQQAFHETHALQCGFCTPGFLMAIEPMLGGVGELDDARLRELIGGNLCRCTGYDSIVSAVRLAHERMAEADQLGLPRDASPRVRAPRDASPRVPTPAPDTPEPARAHSTPRPPRRRRVAVTALAAAAGAAAAGAVAAVGQRRRTR